VNSTNRRTAVPSLRSNGSPPAKYPNINAAVAGMTAQGNAISQGVQVYNGHVQQLTTELARCGNFPVAQMQQQLAAIDQSLGKIHAE